MVHCVVTDNFVVIFRLNIDPEDVSSLTRRMSTSQIMTTFTGAMMALTFLAIIGIITLVQTVEGKPFPAPDLKLCNYTVRSFEGCCTLPVRLGSLKKFDFQPQLPMRVRPAAHLIDDAYIAKYQRAVEIMRALPDTDGRSYLAQYRLHCAYCNNHLYYEGREHPLEIHQNWLFLPWHRLYLYFHERILAKLIGDDEFAIPYWAWDNQSPIPPFPGEIPKAFAHEWSLSPNAINKTSSLYDPDRNSCSKNPQIVEFQNFTACPLPQNKSAVREQNAQLMWTQAVSVSVTPLIMAGAPYRFGDDGGMGMGGIEGRPHGPVHVWTNTKDMGTFKDSAADPIFFSHHANIDRLWEAWKTLPGKYRKDVTDPDYLNTAFTFYDEDGDQVSVTVAQALDLDLLRVKYQELPMAWTDKGTVTEGSKPTWSFCNPKSSESDIAEMVKNTPRFKEPVWLKEGPVTFKLKRRPWLSDRHGEELLQIKANFPWNSSHLINVFAFLPDANYETSSIGCLEYIGNLLSFPHVGQAPAVPPVVNFKMGIRRKLELMGRAHLKEIVITLVGEKTIPSAPPGAQGETGITLTSLKIIHSKK